MHDQDPTPKTPFTEFGESMVKLNPEEREAALRIAAKLLAARDKKFNSESTELSDAPVIPTPQRAASTGPRMFSPPDMLSPAEHQALRKSGEDLIAFALAGFSAQRRSRMNEPRSSTESPDPSDSKNLKESE